MNEVAPGRFTAMERKLAGLLCRRAQSEKECLSRFVVERLGGTGLTSDFFGSPGIAIESVIVDFNGVVEHGHLFGAAQNAIFNGC